MGTIAAGDTAKIEIIGTSIMRLIGNIPVWGDPVDEGALVQIQRSAQHEAVVGAALMADHHKGYAVPIGGVLAYQDAISPSGVGFDIGCGNKAVKTGDVQDPPTGVYTAGEVLLLVYERGLRGRR